MSLLPRFSALIAPATLIAAVFTSHHAHALTISFDEAGDYTGNFTEIANTTTIGYNAEEGAVSQSSSSSFSTAAFNSPIEASGDFSLSLDAKFSGGLGSLGSSSVGFYTNLSDIDGASTGYLVVFRITTGTSADMRIFEGANLNSSNLGGITPTTRSASINNGTFATDTYYTFTLSVTQNTELNSITFSGSIFNPSNNNVLAAFTSYTDASPTNLGADHIGIRLGSTGGSPNNTITSIDNFTAPIPEPSAAAALGGAAALGFAALRRRRRA